PSTAPTTTQKTSSPSDSSTKSGNSDLDPTPSTAPTTTQKTSSPSDSSTKSGTIDLDP
ncbi:hypothetical protein Bpfe_003773, partial [Biomphalaria pfeifferi]